MIPSRILITACVLLVIGCTTQVPFHEVVTIPDMRVHMVSDRSLLSDIPSRAVRGIAGYAVQDFQSPEIWLICKKYKGGIYCRSDVAGHELKHIIEGRRPDLVYRVHNE